MSNEKIVYAVKEWIETIIVGLQLCPFAKKPYNQNSIRYTVSKKDTDEMRIEELIEECLFLDHHQDIETSLIIYPSALLDFFDYSQFIQWANSSLKAKGWQGTYQIASFHPEYEFANTDTNDRENLTNRSPYPIIHLLREDQLEKVIELYPDTSTIPDKNIETINCLSEKEIQQFFYYLFR